ncbi:uncharacterized protein K441DRAFT_369998 [Cenococcum geophilum 1.58]|uniref:uncharacterized protein n=1 Tax=Cenococcum geophilum 1.58 TaxID=794803 RepID=UPI00358E1305|nr:hypothetical protein K441DRAFT_369998 [Cenococcum geophilum 1.58]
MDQWRTCKTCWRLDEDDKPWISASLNSISEARSSCSRCQVLYTIVKSYYSLDELEGLRLNFKSARSFIMEYKSKNQTVQMIYCFKTQPDVTIKHFPSIATCRRPVAQYPDDQSCIDFIKEQLNSCASHPNCDPQRDKPLPKRLVHLGPKENELRLCEVEQSIGKYAALSHCWGKDSQVLKTTSTSIERFKINIPWDNLPKTLQDASIVTRRIGLEYIWIDSLCTIQGDTYKLLVQPRPWNQIFDVRNIGPIGSRGWTYQENALSKRMVHFTRRSIFWECQSELFDESGNTPEEGNNETGLSLIQQFSFFEEDPIITWHAFVEDLACRQLSFWDDKLPCTAGIVSRLQRHTGFQYRAGLWKESIAHDLL